MQNPAASEHTVLNTNTLWRARPLLDESRMIVDSYDTGYINILGERNRQGHFRSASAPCSCPPRWAMPSASHPTASPALSEIRSVLAGLFLASVAMIIAGLATDRTTWFLAVAISMTAAAIGRLVSIAVHGFTPEVAPPLAIEVVIAGLLVLGHYTLS